MNRTSIDDSTTVVMVLDGDTDAGYRLARKLLGEGRRVAAVGHHPGALVRIMHGYPAAQVMVIAADAADERQWRSIVERVTTRFGRLDSVVRAERTALRASA